MNLGSKQVRFSPGNPTSRPICRARRELLAGTWTLAIRDGRASRSPTIQCRCEAANRPASRRVLFDPRHRYPERTNVASGYRPVRDGEFRICGNPQKHISDRTTQRSSFHRCKMKGMSNCRSDGSGKLRRATITANRTSSDHAMTSPVSARFGRHHSVIRAIQLPGGAA